MERTKYNVDKDIEKRTYNNIEFDSILEMKYYRDVLLPMVESGKVKNYELQKKYILQDGFERNGKKVLPITYVADFYIEYSDGTIEVIDTKGMPDTVAKVKRKLFWHRYPDIDYKWVVYIKKFGGWLDYEECQRLRRDENRSKKASQELKEEMNNGEEQESVSECTD